VPTAVVLLSGGMDSCVSCAEALHQGYSVAALHVNYGQLTQDRELQAFNDICDHYNIDQRLVVDISHLASIGGSALTDRTIQLRTNQLATEQFGAEGNSSKSEVPNTYVPFRNANILAIATSWAEVIGATAIFIGAVQEDSSGYPDCTREFFESFQTAINTGTKPETTIQILTPVIDFKKHQIVTRGAELGAPLHKSWSCYTNGDVPCGECDSCRLRERGFYVAQVTDESRL